MTQPAGTIFWGVDRATKATVHVTEVKPGDKSTCVCAACGCPLEARNSANPFRQATRHFRHADPAANDCDGGPLLTALSAVISTVARLTEITLPKRIATAEVESSSGHTVTGVAEVPEEDVQLSGVRFADPFFATTHLPDGRILCFYIVTPGQSGSSPIPDGAAVLRLTADPLKSASSPEEVRANLRRLSPDAWAMHWADDALYERALADANARLDNQQAEHQRASLAAAEAYKRMLEKAEAQRRAQKDTGPLHHLPEPDDRPPRSTIQQAPDPLYRWLPESYLEPETVQHYISLQQAIDPQINWSEVATHISTVRDEPPHVSIPQLSHTFRIRPGVVRDFLIRIGAIKFDEVAWRILLSRSTK